MRSISRSSSCRRSGAGCRGKRPFSSARLRESNPVPQRHCEELLRRSNPLRSGTGREMDCFVVPPSPEDGLRRTLLAMTKRHSPPSSWVRAAFGAPRRMVGLYLRLILRGSQGLAPQDDGGVRGYTPSTYSIEFQTADTRPPSRGMICPRFAYRCPSKRGSRECRMRAAPAVSCAKCTSKNAHEHTGQRRTSDIPCAMALRLISRSPRSIGLFSPPSPADSWLVRARSGRRAFRRLDADH